MADGKVTIDTKLDNSGLEKGIKSVAGSFGGLTKAVGKMSLAITAAFTAAAAAVTKQATDAYADYEQVAGGVETLFKDSAEKVKKYADNAFYTASASANEYMQSVTSFAASLISSLGGDTERAADVANTAMIDMADNASKFGSEIQSIRDAYQGFSRQQYQLLDNLKLGYSGTKTEMERLLKDAQAFSGVKYDINNLADVYEAIHQIQIKLGVAGATAAEAEKTISGSASMTKAAWKNVLIAISGGGDIDKAINNLVYSLSKYFENIVPVAERSLVGIGQLIEKIAPKLVTTVAKSLIKAIPGLVNAVYQMIVGVSSGIYNGIAALFTGQDTAVNLSVQLEDVGAAANTAADAEQKLADGIENAGKAAKKSSANFDELNVLSDNSGSGSADADVSSAFSAATAGSIADVASAAQNLTNTVSPAAEVIGKLFEPLKQIDLNPLKTSLREISGEISRFAAVIGDVFSWVWFNIMVPFGKWRLEKEAPATVEALSSTINAITETVTALQDGTEELWVYVQPVISWIEETVLMVLEDFKEIGDDIAKKWQENGSKVKETFKNLGKVISQVWKVIGPILTWIRNSLSALATGLPGNELQALIDRLFALSQILAGIFTGDFTLMFNGFASAIDAEITYAINQTKTILKSLGIDVEKVEQVVKQVLQRIGEYLSPVAQKVKTIFTNISTWFHDKVVQPLMDYLKPLVKWFGDVFHNIGVIASGCWTIIQFAWDKIVSVWEGAASWFNENVIVPLQEFWAPISEWFSELFGSIEQTLSDVFYNIGVIASGCWEIIKFVWSMVSEWFDTNIIQPVAGFFSDLWTGISNWATEAWENIKAVFAPIGEWINTKIIQPVSAFFSDLWNGFKEKAAEAWENVKGVFSGIAQWAKDILNEFIRALNSGLSKIFSGINSGLGKLRDLHIGELQPFANISRISTPQIPYLAQGAVLPANKPFLAMVGDQKHGTNIEAPLSTIQEAVAMVMQDQTQAILAGFEASVGVQREILEAVLGIQIGDDVIGNAVARYSRKQAVMRGGAL